MKLIYTGLVAGLLLFEAAAFAHEGTHKSIERTTAEIAQQPNQAALYHRRAVLLQDHGNPKDAEADFKKALKLDPDLEGVRLGLGILYFEMGRHDVSRETLSRFLTEQPDHLEGRLYRARTHRALKKYDQAIDDYNRLIDADPFPMPSYYLERAETQLKQELQTEQVIKGLDEGMRKLGPLIALAQRALELEARLGPSKKVFERYEQLIQQSPIFWLEKKAAYLESLGRTKEARVACKRLVDQLDRLPPRRLKAPRYARLLKRIQAKLAESR